METLKVFIVLLLVLDAVGTIALIGEQRKPITRTQAVITTLVNAGLIYWILAFWI